MKKLAMRLGVLVAGCLMLVSAPMAFAPAPAQAQGLYVQFGVGPQYGGYDDRRGDFCRAAYWHHDWQAMRWCEWHGAYGR